MTKKTKRRRNRLSKRYSKKRLSKRYSKKRLSKKRYSKKLSRKKRVSRTKRKMKGGSDAERMEIAAALGISVEGLKGYGGSSSMRGQAPEPAPAPAPPPSYASTRHDRFGEDAAMHAVIAKSKMMAETRLREEEAEEAILQEVLAESQREEPEPAPAPAPAPGQASRLHGAEARRMATEEATDLEGVTGLKKHKIQGDGDCMFTSVLYCNGDDNNLSRDYPLIRGLCYGGDTIRAIRGLVANWLDKNWENIFSEQIILLSDDDTSHGKQDSINDVIMVGREDEDDDEDRQTNLVAETYETIATMNEDSPLLREDYIRRIREWNKEGGNAFGGKAELIALSNILNLKITQYNRSSNRDEYNTYSVKNCRIYEPKKGVATREIYLVQRSGGRAQTDGDHYDGLIPGDGGAGTSGAGGAVAVASAPPAHLVAGSASMGYADHSGGVAGGENWDCSSCTFINDQSNEKCEICGSSPAGSRIIASEREPEPELQPDIEYQTIPEAARDKHLVYITGVCFWGESENIVKIVNHRFLDNILKQFGYDKQNVYFVFIDPGEGIVGMPIPDCSKVEEGVTRLKDEYHVEFQKRFFCGSPEFSKKRGEYDNYAIIMSGIFSYKSDTLAPTIATLVTDSGSGKLQIISPPTGAGEPGIILERDVTHYIPLSMYQEGVGELHACSFFKNEDGNITHFFEKIYTKFRAAFDLIPEINVLKIGSESYISHYDFYNFINKKNSGELCKYMTELFE
jgi:hypothetical protein